MSIIENAGLRKLQEHLLHKGEQNRVTSLKLGRVLVVAKYIYKRSELECIGDLVEWVEDQQMVIGGRSRSDYLESIKYMPPEKNENEGGKK